MRYRIILSFLCCIYLNLSQAQVKTFKTENGTWSVTGFNEHVTKLVFQPKQYLTNENITAAVIAKPAFVKVDAQALAGDGMMVGFVNKLIVEYAATEGYKGFRVKLQPTEKIFGGGERALPMNRRGLRFPLYNNPWYGYGEGADALNFSVPFFTSSEGYALFFDNASKGYADIGKTTADIFEAGFVSGELNVYVITGKDYKEILSAYYKLTGTQPMPPRWAFGNFQSRFGYTSEQQAKEINQKMIDEKIPQDAIIFDLFWFGDSIQKTLGNLDWINKTKWPNPAGMIKDFKKKNINTILITEPFILEKTKKYEESKKYFAVDSSGKPFRLTDFYFGYGGLLDVFRKDASDWIWNNHYKKQIKNGVAAWWTDLGEPEKHPSAIMHNLKSLGYQRMFSADEVHNAYGHYWNKMLFENYAKDYPNQRLFHLNRSGFSGSQRFSIFPWSGDVSRSWSGLKAQLPLMLGMSMSGIPYIHADAGGFAGGEGDNELYVRWLEFASFTPIFRPHGTALYEVDKNAFSFPSEPALIGEPYKNYAKAVVKMRYGMLPYNYTLAYLQATKGVPLVAPLYYYFSNDTAVYNVSDEFMWGENILVAPVIEKNVAQRNVYLPAGYWYANNSNEMLSGNQNIVAAAPIDNIPFYVKAGSFIVTSAASEAMNTTEDKADKLVVSYYFTKENSSTELYNDDGESKNAIASKQYQLIRFAKTGNSNLSFVVKSTGAYKGMPTSRQLHFKLYGVTVKVGKLFVNHQFITNLSKDGDTGTFNFKLNFSGKSLLIEIK